MYPRADYGTHGRQLLRDVHRVSAATQQSPDPATRGKVFFLIETAPQVKVREKYQLLKSELGISVVGTPTPTTALAASDRDTFHNLETRIAEYAASATHRGKSYVSFIEKLGPIPGESKFSHSLKDLLATRAGPVPVLIQLFTTLTENEGQLVADAIEGVAHRFHGDTEELFRTASGRLALPALLDQKALQYLAENYPSVMQFDSNSPLFLPDLAEFQPIAGEITVQPLATDITVGVVDTGIEPNATYLAEALNGLDIQTPPGVGHQLSHGTFVASRVVYGDTLEEQIGRGILEPKVRVRDIRFFHAAQGGVQGPPASEFSKRMQQIVIGNPDIKIYNLSFVYTDQRVADDEVSFVASELDALAREHGVLFVVAAGNFPLRGETLPTQPYPAFFADESTRMMGPADLFNGLSVGAVALRHNGGAMANSTEPSPISRRGPAVGGARKPDLAAHGGNVTLNWGQQASLSTVGLDNASSSLRFGVGTSFAAPIVASYAAQLLASYPSSSTNMLRALLIHSAVPPTSRRFTPAQMVGHVGHGVADLDRALNTLGSRVCYLFEGVLPAQRYQTVTFRVPKILETQRTGPKLKVKVTVTFTPPTDRGKGVDYSAVHFYAKLRKINSKGQLVDVPPDSNEDAPENCRDKFFPVVSFSKAFVSGFQGGDWNVELRMSTRWDVGPQFQQPYAMVVSIEDPRGTLDVYTAVQLEVPNVYQEATRVAVEPNQG